MSQKKERVINSLDSKYPANDHTSKKKVEKKVSRITTGKVVRKKKTLGGKFKETFFGESIEGVASYIIYDVVIPSAKNLLSDTINNGLDMLLFGQVKGSRTRRDKSKSYVSYSNYYKDDPRTTGRKVDRPVTKRSTHNFDDVILEDRGEAEQVISCLVDLIEEYGMASVADLYDLIDVTSSFTDNKYGWDNLSTATVSRVRDGYLINLPKSIVLE